MQKVFKTIDEQVEILKNKGLIIDDDTKVAEILIRENYFFLSGYRHLFLKNERSNDYREGTTFRELYALFNFDRQLRNIIFKNILIIENNIKSIMSYALSKKYGIREKDYLRASNFNNSKERIRQVNDLLRKIKRQIKINGSQHSATTHYIYNYGYIPLWVSVKVISFGIICELYSILKYDDQKEISKMFGIEINELLSYFPILSNYRNLCAHEDILYDHRTASMIPNSKYHELFNIEQEDNEYVQGKNDLFALLIILKQMLLPDDFRLMMKEIDYEKDILSGKLETIDIKAVLDKMGIPENYTELIDM